jgi:septal ring factor EnvC (AmiA/AmiB activator)
MGKISEAFKRSGDVIDQKHFARRTLNENALTPLEKKLLRQAGRDYEQKNASISALGQNQQIPLSKKIDSLLMNLGLSKAHISEQTIKELNQSLSRIDGYITRPKSFLKQNFRDTVNSETDFKLYILPILLERRRLILENYDELVGRIKNYDLRVLIKRISDTNVKSSIDKILNDLQKKNLILKKEYQKIEKARQDIYFEQQKFSSMRKESRENINKTSKFIHARESVITWIMGTLLILIALVIAIAPFANTPVPDILTSTFLIILGFFFGHGIGRFASFRETKN